VDVLGFDETSPQEAPHGAVNLEFSCIVRSPPSTNTCMVPLTVCGSGSLRAEKEVAEGRAVIQFFLCQALFFNLGLRALGSTLLHRILVQGALFGVSLAKASGGNCDFASVVLVVVISQSPSLTLSGWMLPPAYRATEAVTISPQDHDSPGNSLLDAGLAVT